MYSYFTLISSIVNDKVKYTNYKNRAPESFPGPSAAVTRSPCNHEPFLNWPAIVTTAEDGFY